MKQRLAAIVGTISASILMATSGFLWSQASHADGAIAASAEQVVPVHSGQRAPSFSVRDAGGAEFVFDPGALERPVVLISFRGGWCPWCNLHLSELRTVVPQIGASGVDVIFLSGDRPELLYSSLQADTQEEIDGLGYRIYSDADANAATALGIAFKVDTRTVNRRHDKGQDIAGSSMLRHGVLAVPAVFAIDRDGVIHFAFVEADYKVRLAADKLLVVARELAAERSD